VTDEAFARPRLQLFSGGIGTVDRPSAVPDALLGFALAMLIFYPRLTAQLHASMTPLIVVIFLIWLNGALERQREAGSALHVIALVITYVMGMTVLAKLVARLAGATTATTVQHILLLLPLCLAAGWVLVRTGRIIHYLSWLLIVGIVTVPLAIYENLANTSVISARILERNGSTRAIVGSEHPLVLGALFLALIPVAMYVGGRYRYLCSALLYVGILTTGSNGPEIVGVLILVVCLVPLLARWTLSTVWPLIALWVGIGVYLFVGATWLWTTQIHGTSTTDVSNQYRAALYALLPRLLHDRPLGYGFGGLPPDTLYVSTQSSGIQDVSKSVDSEFVYGVTQFGYIAVVFFMVAAAFSVFAAARNHAVGLSLLSTTLVGLFLSIHSWNSLGALWFLQIGACAALAIGNDGSADWVGLYRRRAAPEHQVEVGVT
jgi:hypothetical protein